MKMSIYARSDMSRQTNFNHILKSFNYFHDMKVTFEDMLGYNDEAECRPPLPRTLIPILRQTPYFFVHPYVAETPSVLML